MQVLSDLTKDSVSAFAQGALAFPERQTRFAAHLDCLFPVANGFEDGYQYVVNGTGAAWTSQAAGADNAVGIVRLALGTLATGRGSIACPDLACVRQGNGVASFAARLRLVSLSDLTNTYTARLGFIDSVTAESTDGVFFRYTNAVNGGRWQAVCRSNGTETLADTGIAATAQTAPNWRKFTIQVNAAGTSATFRIDGALVATITTNIPAAAGRETGFGLFILRTLGTTAINAVDVDYLETEVVFTTAR